MRRHDKEETEMFQSDLKEAADYMKPILDNMVSDLRAKQAEAQAELEQNVDDFTAEAKAQIAEQAKADLDNLESWINDTFAGVQEFTETSYDDLEAQWDEAVSFATKTTTTASSDYSIYGYGALTIGIAAAAVYFAKKQKKTTKTDAKESLLEVDEEFVLV